ncbi:hypothetical protein D9753_28370 [Streptomyces dangxiongensis]|uniref:Uncharacterized protein n=1 Tax=Streptomyces dangxiongensis TaxID=1442032 RepID=A0A3G2JQ75_9ACTN|nr:hypothetical protein [Streptomyces dangxiongensis]AYN42157.1 hypothetical protein D9753_28370 [Streptomyces dangxiongensis]
MPPAGRPSPERDRPRPERAGPLLTQRAAMVFLLAALAGIGATVLAALAGDVWPVAVSVGSGTAATAVLFFREIID